MERKLYTKEEIEKKLAALPQDIGSLIYSSEMDAAMQQISTKHQLHIDQMGSLETAVVDTMTGIEPASTFIERVTESLEIDGTKAGAIADDVNQLLFLKIRESMKKVSGELSAPEQNAPAAATQAPTPQIIPAAPAKPEPPHMPVADAMLSRQTVSTPAPEPPAAATAPTIAEPPASNPPPTQYKTDPYREPPE